MKRKQSWSWPRSSHLLSLFLCPSVLGSPVEDPCWPGHFWDNINQNVAFFPCCFPFVRTWHRSEVACQGINETVLCLVFSWPPLTLRLWDLSCPESNRSSASLRVLYEPCAFGVPLERRLCASLCHLCHWPSLRSCVLVPPHMAPSHISNVSSLAFSIENTLPETRAWW